MKFEIHLSDEEQKAIKPWGDALRNLTDVTAGMGAVVGTIACGGVCIEQFAHGHTYTGVALLSGTGSAIKGTHHFISEMITEHRARKNPAIYSEPGEA